MCIFSIQNKKLKHIGGKIMNKKRIIFVYRQIESLDVFARFVDDLFIRIESINLIKVDGGLNMSINKEYCASEAIKVFEKLRKDNDDILVTGDYINLGEYYPHINFNVGITLSEFENEIKNYVKKDL